MSISIVTKIKVTNYRGFVPGDDILTKGSVHYVCDPPTNYQQASTNGERGYWVKGSNDKPILILHGEYVIEERK